jgi:hypothetical protein
MKVHAEPVSATILIAERRDDDSCFGDEWSTSDVYATRTTLPISMSEFLQRIAKGGGVDLR